MKQRLVTLVLSVVLTATASAAAFAQGGATSSLAGTVTDTSGAVLPGVTVTAKHNGTGTVSTAVTADNGTFHIPALNPGAYTVTITLAGFKTVALNDVVLSVGAPSAVRAQLELGTLEETIVVEGASPVVQTQASAVATTINIEAIKNVPITSRNVLDVVPLLPGVNTPGGNRDSTVLGLQQSAINITLDGVNIQDNTLKTTDGFFTIVQPRLDAVEEVTVTTAAQGADVAGQGAVQIRFITRSGTNDFHGSVYEYFRSDALNATTWFNKRNNIAKPELLLNQPGFRVGGPMTIPGLFNGRDKAFFFVNWEWSLSPSTVARDRTILHPSAQAGNFLYNTAGGVRSVNLLALAAANGQTSTFDPIISSLLADIRSATGTTGTITDLAEPILQRYWYNVPVDSTGRLPTVRVDFNLTSNHRLSGVANYHTFSTTPDTLNNRDSRFPGFPATGTQTSKRMLFSSALRSTLGQSMVNEMRVGYSGAPVYFFKELASGMWGGGGAANQGGYYLDIATALMLAPNAPTASNTMNASNTPTPSSRNATTLLVEDTMNWLKGRHSFSLGGSFTQADIWLKNQNLVAELDYGMVSNDPALGMFSTANFPGASGTQLQLAQNLYAVLTGRVSQVSGNARIDETTGQYTYLGEAIQRAQMRDFGFFVQDSWRMRPNLTANFGLRYELQMPFTAKNDSYSTATLDSLCGLSGVASGGGCNLFQAGSMPGQKPEFINLAEGQSVYDTDWNNWAPNVGFNWTPSAEGGLLGSMLGQEGDTSISGGFTMSFNRNGLSDFTDIFGANPGVAVTVNRSLGQGNLGTLPLLMRNSASLNPPSFASEPVYPMGDVVTEDINIFDQGLQVPYSQSWTIGIQRQIGQTMAVEARYVGTRGANIWSTQNHNEVNFLDNGFLNEFRLAQQNLQANIAAGRGNNFRYAGPNTGTSPLPIYLAYFGGSTAAATPGAYSSPLFQDNTFVTQLARFLPQPYAAANALDADATRRANATRAGLPANFLVANPDLLGGADLTESDEKTKYHGLILEFRRRMSDGLQFQTSYAHGQTGVAEFFSFRRPREYRRDAGAEGEVTKAWKALWVWDLPFGQGRRFGSNANGFVDRLIGGWAVTGTARVQSGQMINLGNVNLVGMSLDDVGDLFKLRIDNDRKVWMLPQDVIDNTIRAFSVSATSPTGYSALGAPTGRYLAPAAGPDCIEVDPPPAAGQRTSEPRETGVFGDCGTGELVATGPLFKSFDISVLKRIAIAGRVNADIRFEVLNAFNNVNFVPVGGIGAQSGAYEVLALTGTQTARTTQIVFRVNW